MAQLSRQFLESRLITSNVFGEFTAPENRVFSFPYGIPGLETEKEFTFLNVKEYEPLIWMVSVNGSFHFPVLPLTSLNEDDLDEWSKKTYLPQLQNLLIKNQQAVAYVILKLGGKVEKISLRAPIIVHTDTNLGEQVIFDRFQIGAHS